MDSIPNEILVQIICCLEKEEIPKMRLISNRFNLVATECVQKLCQVNFTTESDIANFVTMFQNRAVVPFEKFGFCEYLLAGGQDLKQFCVQFGKVVRHWSVLTVFCPPPEEQNSLSKNVEILLENCVNVEKIDLLLEEESYKFTKIPLLLNLKTLTITWYDTEQNADLLLFLNQIFEKAPKLRSVTIEDLVGACPAKMTDILNQLYNMTEDVHIEKLYLSLVLPLTNVDDLQNLVAIATQFRIVDLNLSIKVEDDHPNGLSQQVEILSKLIQNLTSVRTLYLDSWRNVPITMPLHSLANLQCLTVENLLISTPVVPDKQTEFPVLTSLICRYEKHINNFCFSGCVFPNVKFAEIHLRTEEECEQWPQVLPNVEELFVETETLEGIFRFPQLRKLNITIVPGIGVDDVTVRRQHWNYLTGGATYVPDTRIWSVPVSTHTMSDSIDSFRNLPLLTELTFKRENIECWKGVIYASRTGQLGRLQKLDFTLGYFTVGKLNRMVLLQYHDLVSSNYPDEE